MENSRPWWRSGQKVPPLPCTPSPPAASLRYMSQNLSFSINQTPFVPQQQVFLTNILAHAVWCVLCLLVDCQKGHNLGVPTFANNYRVSQKTHFQNHHPASWHVREIPRGCLEPASQACGLGWIVGPQWWFWKCVFFGTLCIIRYSIVNNTIFY